MGAVLSLGRLALAAGIVAGWWLAAATWPELPARVPVHFDAAGHPDRWATKEPWSWFGLPALGSAIGLLLGVALPPWVRRLARRNAPYLSVPNRRAFAALPAAARERAVAAPMGWLVMLAATQQALFLWLVYGAGRVARGEWSVLPPAVTYGLVGLLLLQAAGLAVAGHRAVQREVERAAA